MNKSRQRPCDEVGLRGKFCGLCWGNHFLGEADRTRDRGRDFVRAERNFHFPGTFRSSLHCWETDEKKPDAEIDLSWGVSNPKQNGFLSQTFPTNPRELCFLNRPFHQISRKTFFPPCLDDEHVVLSVLTWKETNAEVLIYSARNCFLSPLRPRGR